MLDVMVDIETTGVDPSFNAIIQIAAIRFNYETNEVGPAYVASLDTPPNRFWDEGTREWWMDKLDVYQDIVAKARPAAVVMREFAQWAFDTAPAIGDQRLWAKPISFEWPFLQSYARQFDVTLPFHYRLCRDLNSFIAGVRGNPEHWPLERQLTFTGDAHNAIDDVGHQVKVALMSKYHDQA